MIHLKRRTGLRHNLLTPILNGGRIAVEDTISYNDDNSIAHSSLLCGTITTSNGLLVSLEARSSNSTSARTTFSQVFDEWAEDGNRYEPYDDVDYSGLDVCKEHPRSPPELGIVYDRHIPCATVYFRVCVNSGCPYYGFGSVRYKALDVIEALPDLIRCKPGDVAALLVNPHSAMGLIPYKLGNAVVYARGLYELAEIVPLWRTKIETAAASLIPRSIIKVSSRTLYMWSENGEEYDVITTVDPGAVPYYPDSDYCPHRLERWAAAKGLEHYSIHLFTGYSCGQRYYDLRNAQGLSVDKMVVI